MKNSACKGYYNISLKLLKYCSAEFSDVISHLVNESFQCGLFPEMAKTAKVVSIFKNGDPKLLTNYRPISILTNFSKFFEKAAFTRVSGYLDKFKIIHQNQYGFRKKFSTYAMLKLVDETGKSLLAYFWN